MRAKRNMSKKHKNPARRLTRIYGVALTFIALLTITGQWLARRTLNAQSADAIVINISGRQRMLSQNITKNALLLGQCRYDMAFQERQKEFRKVFNLWQKSHHALQYGNSEMRIPANYNSPKIKALFEEMSPFYNAIQLSAKRIEKLYCDDSIEVQKGINTILSHEQEFLRLMNDITFQYEAESHNKVEYSKNIELILALITLVVLVFEGFFVFRPAVQKVSTFFKTIFKQQTQLERYIQELHINEEKLRQQSEELQQKQVEIKEKNQHLTKVNTEMERHHQEISNAFLQVQKKQKIIETKNQQITKSIQQALRIQKAILPQIQELRQILQDFFILFRPKDIVSGDFYWAFENQKYVFVVIADCTGHGVPGGFMSMLGTTFLDEIVLGKNIDTPNLILEKLDIEIRQSLRQDETNGLSGMDISFVRFEKEKQELTFSGSKLPIYVYQNETLEVYKGNKRMVGGYKRKRHNKPFSNLKVSLNEGALVYMFTDGFIDQSNPKLERFGTPRFFELIRQNSTLPLAQIHKNLYKGLEEHQREASQRDDITVAGIIF